jgi:adenylate cyclase
MRLPRHFPIAAREILRFTVVATVVGAVYGHHRAIVDGAPWLSTAGIARGMLTGALIGAGWASVSRLLALPAVAALRLPFLLHGALKALVLFVLIVAGLVIGAWVFPTPDEIGSWLPFKAHTVVFSFVVGWVYSFLDDVNHLLGHNVLFHFLTGRYYRPRQEQRVFLFIDMEGSTELAERLGELEFHRLVNRFVVDLSEAIVAWRGEVHKYVGDELIATWRLRDGVAEARCVRACFEAFDRLAARAPFYRREFGAAIECRAGLHCGPVVAGEMGSVKREIAFLGDTVNTTARVKEFCRQTGDRILASAQLVDRLALPADISKRPLGDRHLRGKRSDVALYALERTPPPAALAAQ